MRVHAPPLLMFAALLLGCEGGGSGSTGGDEDGPVDITQLETIAELDELSLFTFGIFSDNKGDGPDTGEFGYVRTMIDATVAMDARFVLGIGDHVKRHAGVTQDWVTFMTTDSWWFDNFYPVIADGENAYYGTGQGDWGAGRGLLDDLAFCDKENVTCRANGAEYHAVIAAEGIDVHFVVAHYPDSGDDPFPEDSQRYLLSELQGITRTGREIVIATAHTGQWLASKRWALGEGARQSVLDGADLLLGASTHFYTRYEYPDDQALYMNTGATGYSFLYNNYIQVSVLDDPLRIVFQNMPADGERTLQTGGNCWIKEIQGPVRECGFVHGQAWGAEARWL